MKALIEATLGPAELTGFGSARERDQAGGVRLGTFSDGLRTSSSCLGFRV